MRRILILFGCFGLLAIVPANVALSMPPPNDKLRFHDYTIIVTNNEATLSGTLEIILGETSIYKEEGLYFLIGYYDPRHHLEKVSAVKDITGDGIPNFVITEWSGAIHRCFTFHIFELLEHVKRIASLEVYHAGLSYFVDLNGDAILEFVTFDSTFAYWRACFAESPAPGVILHYTQGKYRLALDLMKRSPLSSTEFNDMVQQILSQGSWHQGKPPVELWSNMLTFIYGGHVDFAWKLFEQAWNEEVGGKEQFLVDFQAKLKKSPYWEELQHFNENNLSKAFGFDKKWLIIIVIAVIAGFLYYRFILVKHGNLKFWKFVNAHPEEAYSFFMDNDAFVIFDNKPIDGYKANLPSGDWDGPFKIYVPSKYKVVTIYGRHPEFQIAQKDFMRSFHR